MRTGNRNKGHRQHLVSLRRDRTLYKEPGFPALERERRSFAVSARRLFQLVVCFSQLVVCFSKRVVCFSSSSVLARRLFQLVLVVCFSKLVVCFSKLVVCVSARRLFQQARRLFQPARCLFKQARRLFKLVPDERTQLWGGDRPVDIPGVGAKDVERGGRDRSVDIQESCGEGGRDRPVDIPGGGGQSCGKERTGLPGIQPSGWIPGYSLWASSLALLGHHCVVFELQCFLGGRGNFKAFKVDTTGASILGISDLRDRRATAVTRSPSRRKRFGYRPSQIPGGLDTDHPSSDMNYSNIGRLCTETVPKNEPQATPVREPHRENTSQGENLSPEDTLPLYRQDSTTGKYHCRAWQCGYHRVERAGRHRPGREPRNDTFTGLLRTNQRTQQLQEDTVVCLCDEINSSVAVT
ncbi:hypothetical protein Bbelb_244420 [Branchiostoma belcheri]|nr:hypothetical protein Bbelb_244420 [Branchiostoma belcheri]